MPSCTDRCGKFNFEVACGKEILREYEHENKQYVGVDFFTTNSYFIEDQDEKKSGSKQKYPGTPFKVFLFMDIKTAGCWFYMYVDGQRIWNKPFDAGNRAFTISGFKSGSEIRELVFTLPKIDETSQDQTEQHETGSLSMLGTIKMVCYEAYPTHQRSFVSRSRLAPTECSSITLHETNLKHATKQECYKAGSLGISTREGQVVMRSEETAPRTMYQTVFMKMNRIIGEATLHYRPLAILRDMGIEVEKQNKEMEAAEAPKTEVKPESHEENHLQENTNPESPYENHLPVQKNVKPECLIPHANKLNNVNVKQEMTDKNICPLSLNIKRELCKSPLVDKAETIKREVMHHVDLPLAVRDMNIKETQSPLPKAMKLEPEFVCDIDDYDDIIDLECDMSLDESVVCMGDDSCFMFEVSTAEVSIVDLANATMPV